MADLKTALSAALGVSAQIAETWSAPLRAAMDRYAINTPQRMAAFLAQIAQESGCLRAVREIWGPTSWQLKYDQVLGNNKPDAVRVATAHGCKPGFFWRGHGLIQVTGYDNHVACGQALGLDLINHPELLEQPGNAAMSAGWFWNERGLNALADAGRIDDITRRVNGSAMLGAMDRRRYYAQFIAAFGA